MMITSSGITISFGGTRDGGDDSRPVVARIYGFESGADEAPIIRQMVVPAGKSVEEKLPQGLYSVELTLPSGRIIQRNVRIHERSNEVYRFFDDFAKPAGFSLQESIARNSEDVLESAILADRWSQAAFEEATAEMARPTLKLRGLGEAKSRRMGFDPDGPGISRPPEPRLPTVSLGTGPVVSEGGEQLDVQAWENLRPVKWQGTTGIWRSAHASHYRPESALRRWTRVALSSGAVEIASLPLPWFCVGTASFAEAEILVDPSKVEGAATRVAVRDERLSSLLAFLDHGQAASAGPMLEALESENLIERTIYDKVNNPLAACAAAYVGLAVYLPGEREQWDGWLGNLANRFEGVPDAAIVHARRLILRPTPGEINQEAAQMLRRACKAGVPYFSAGVGLLREMLMQLSPDFPDLEPLAGNAARLAARVDAHQIFTVLRYAPAKGGTR